MSQNNRAPAPLAGPDEACHTLQIGLSKYWELIRDGHLEAVRLGRRCTRVTRASLDRLASQGVPSREVA